MEDLSNSTHRSTMQSRNNKREPQRHDYTFEGHPVAIVESFSRGGKRIAVIQNKDGELFEIFFEQLD